MGAAASTDSLAALHGPTDPLADRRRPKDTEASAGQPVSLPSYNLPPPPPPRYNAASTGDDSGRHQHSRHAPLLTGPKKTNPDTPFSTPTKGTLKSTPNTSPKPFPKKAAPAVRTAPTTPVRAYYANTNALAGARTNPTTMTYAVSAQAATPQAVPRRLIPLPPPLPPQMGAAAYPVASPSPRRTPMKAASPPTALPPISSPIHPRGVNSSPHQGTTTTTIVVFTSGGKSNTNEPSVSRFTQKPSKMARVG